MSNKYRLTREVVLPSLLILTSLSTETFAGLYNEFNLKREKGPKAFFFSTSGSLYGAYSPGAFSIWQYNTFTSSFSYCAHLPGCLCQACCGKTRSSIKFGSSRRG